MTCMPYKSPSRSFVILIVFVWLISSLLCFPFYFTHSQWQLSKSRVCNLIPLCVLVSVWQPGSLRYWFSFIEFPPFVVIAPSQRKLSVGGWCSRRRSCCLFILSSSVVLLCYTISFTSAFFPRSVLCYSLEWSKVTWASLSYLTHLFRNPTSSEKTNLCNLRIHVFEAASSCRQTR